MLPSGLLKIVGVCQGHLDYTARSCHFYSVVTTFTRLGKVPTLRAIGKRAEVTDQVERLDYESRRQSEADQDTGYVVAVVCRDRADREELLKQWGITPTGEPVEFVVKEKISG